MQISYRGRDSLYSALKQEAKQRLVFNLVGVLVISVLFWNFRTSILISFLALIGLILFISLTLNSLKTIKDHKYSCKVLLEHKPESIVWVYSIKTQRLPFGISVSDAILLYFKTLDRKEYSVKVQEKELAEIMIYLNAHLPQATFGYSVDNDQWYEADPHLLLRNHK